jgi:putative ABC transport system permease protein
VRHQLIHRALRGRLARGSLTAVGILAGTLLVLVLLAAQRGVRNGVMTYVNQDAVDVWVTPQGTDNFVRSSTTLGPEQIADVEELEGLEAFPVLRAFVSVVAKAPRGAAQLPLTLFAIGYRVPQGLGGPPRLAAGRLPQGPQEVALDRAAAFSLALELGDAILINGITATVVGFSDGTNLMSTQLLFCDLTALETAMSLKGRASVLAVHSHGEDPAQLAARLEANAIGVSAYPRGVFAENNAREVTAGIAPMIGLIALLGVLVSTVLVALLVQVLIDDRRSDLCVLTAMGSSLSSMVLAALRRVAVLILMGCVSGWGAFLLLSACLDRFLPTVPLAGTPVDALLGGGLFLVCGCTAALVPLLRIARLDPMEAFRS